MLNVELELQNTNPKKTDAGTGEYLFNNVIRNSILWYIVYKITRASTFIVINLQDMCGRVSTI